MEEEPGKHSRKVHQVLKMLVGRGTCHIMLLKVTQKDSAQHNGGYSMLELCCTEDCPCRAHMTPLLVTVPFTGMKAPWRNARTVLLISFRTEVSSWFLVAPQELFVYVFLFKRALSLEKGRGFKECGS